MCNFAEDSYDHLPRSMLKIFLSLFFKIIFELIFLKVDWIDFSKWAIQKKVLKKTYLAKKFRRQTFRPQN